MTTRRQDICPLHLITINTQKREVQHVNTTITMLTLTLTNEQLQAGFQAHLDKLMQVDNYNNPIKSAFDKLFGYSGSMQGELNQWVADNMKTVMSTPQFQLALGQAMAQEIAKREVDKLSRK